MKTYFALSEYDDGEHIGVVAVSNTNTEGFKFAIKDALEAHFDVEVPMLQIEMIEEILSSYRPYVFGIRFNDGSYITRNIQIVKTYIYE